MNNSLFSFVVMIDCSAENITVPLLTEAIKSGIVATQTIIESIDELVSHCGREKKGVKMEDLLDEEIQAKIERLK